MYHYLNFKKNKIDKKRVMNLQPSSTIKGKNVDKITRENVDTIKNFPQTDYLDVSKLKDDNFEYLAKNYGKQFRIVSLWRCQRISSLKPMEYFENLEIFDGDWNIVASSLWDCRKTPNLTAINLNGYSKIHDLSPLAELENLREFIFQMGMHNNRAVIDSLQPLTKLPNLEYLSLQADKIGDGDITPLGNLPKLKELDLFNRMFTLPQYAWLKNKIGGRVKCDIFDSDTYSFTISILGGSSTVYERQMVLGIGERPGKKYDEKVDAALDWFAKHPQAKPEDYQGQ